MPSKTKNHKTPGDKVALLAQQAGLLLMTAATTVGLVEVPEHFSKIVIPAQPAFAFNSPVQESENNNPMRREREEAGPHYVSYSTAQRTPGRHGRA